MKEGVFYPDNTIQHKIEAIKNMAADICATSYTDISHLSNLMLALPNYDETPELGGKSGLNADGTPIQFCISSKKENWAGRFITDPASIYGNTEKRYLKSVEAIHQLFEKNNSEELKPLFENMLNFHLPENKSLEDYPDGVFWLGAPINSDGIAIYMDGRRGGNDISWNRLKAWLQYVMPKIEKLDSWIEAMIKVGDIMSIGFEGSTLKNVRIKVYWRLKEPVLLDSLQFDILKNQEYKSFLDELIADKDMDLFGIVFCGGFHVASQQFFDAKIDVCGCRNCLNMQPDEWVKTLNYFTQKYQLNSFPITQEILEENAAVSYFGFGMDIRNEKRLNLYLKNNGKIK